MMLVNNWFSQTRNLRVRRERGLHPISELNRFAIVVCGLFCGMCVSLTFAYDLFTAEFRDAFHLSAGDLSTVSTVGLVFNYFLLPYSPIFETCGPFLPFMICLVRGLIGTICVALTFTGAIPGNTATITVFYSFVNTASGLIDATYIPTLFEIFPRNRGLVVCLAKVMTGLGSTILACLSTTLFKSSIVGFIYFLCGFISAVSIAASALIVLPPYYMNWWRMRGKTAEEIAELRATRPLYQHKSVPRRRLMVGYCVIAAILIFFTVETPVVAYVGGVSRSSEVAIGVLACVLTMCMFLMALPVRWLGGMDEPAPSAQEMRVLAQAYELTASESEDSAAVADARTKKTEPVMAADATADLDASGALELRDAVESDATAAGADDCAGSTGLVSARQDPRYGGASLKDYLLSLDLWLLLLYMLSVVPLGIMVSYKGSTISIAKTGKPRTRGLGALYTAFLGLGNSVGRIAFGSFESYVQHARGRSNGGGRLLVTAALFVCPSLAALGGTLLLVLPGNVVLLPFILVYIMNGFNAALQALIFTCLFERYHNTLYNMGFMVTVVVVVLFNRVLFGMYVDSQHDKLNLSSSQECNKQVCIQTPIIVGTCMGAAGLIVAAVTHVRYTRFVARVEKSRADAERVSSEPVE